MSALTTRLLSAPLAGCLCTLLSQCGSAGLASPQSSSSAPPSSGTLTLRLEDGSDLPVVLDGCGWYHTNTTGGDFGSARPPSSSATPTRGAVPSAARYVIYAPQLPTATASLAGRMEVRLTDPGGSIASWEAVSGMGYLRATGGVVASTGEFDSVVLQKAGNTGDEIFLGGAWSCDEGQPR